MKTHEVPVKLFAALHAKWGRESVDEVKESGSTVKVFRAVVADLREIECWFSLTEYAGERPISILRMWPRKPGDRDDFNAPWCVFAVRGGPIQTGSWTYGKGNHYATDVTIDYDRGASGSLLNVRHGLRVAVASRVLGELFALLDAEEVVTEEFYDGQGEEP